MVRLFPAAFDHFDPLTGLVPEFFSRDFQHIADRARDILSQRSSDEIKSAYRAIRLHLQERDFEVMEEFRALPANSSLISPASVVFELLGLIHKVKLGADYDLPNATWPEYFAALALGLIGHARALTSDLQQYSNYNGPEIELARQHDAAEFAISATEAVMIGAMLQREIPVIPISTEMRFSGDVIEREAARKISGRNRDAVNERHKQSKEIKTAVLGRYESLAHKNPKISNRDAAKRIAKLLLPPETTFEKRHSREETFAKWIGEYKTKSMPNT